MRRVLLIVVVAAFAATGCSKSSHDSTAPTTTVATTTTTGVPPTKASIAALDRVVCSAYDAFWHTSYSGAEPSAAMLGRERALVHAAEAAIDTPLHDAVRSVIDGELGLPKFLLHDTVQEFQQKQNQLSPDVRAALDEVRQYDQAVRSRCAAVGRPVTV